VWKQVKDQVQHGNRPLNKDKMWTSINLAWEDIPQEKYLEVDFCNTKPNGSCDSC
jgi:hypothetical protein